MGAAIGYGLAQSASSTFAVFTALGVGMALPYALLAFFPGWRKYLPSPGPWMVRLKQILAFPLYATVIWLAWVLGAQLDNDAVARLATVLLLIAIALWAWQTRRTGGARGWGWAALAGLVAGQPGDRDPARALARHADHRGVAAGCPGAGLSDCCVIE